MPLGWAYLLDRFLQHRDHEPILLEHFGTRVRYTLDWDAATRMPRDAVNNDFMDWADAARRKMFTSTDVNRELRVLFEAGAVRNTSLQSSRPPTLTVRVQDKAKQYNSYDVAPLNEVWAMMVQRGYIGEQEAKPAPAESGKADTADESA